MQQRNKTVRNGILWVAAACLLSISQTPTRAFAEGPKISGFVDTTYIYNFNRPASATNGFRSYDAANDTILLNNAQLTFEGTLSDGVGYVIEPNFGSDAGVNTSAGFGTADDFDIQEAYLTYKITDMPVELKAGKFVTLQGIEVIESQDNFIISRGFLYGLAEAFTHVGALATVSAPKIVSVSVGLVNGWDIATDNNSGKTLISRLGLDFGDLLSGGFAFYYGPEKAGNTNDQRLSIDSTWFSKPMEKLTLAFQANAGQEDKTSLIHGGLSHWYGLTFQPMLQITDMVGLGARYEWFQNLDGDRAADPNVATRGIVLQNFTLAPSLKLTESILLRAEYRYDWSSEPAFETSDGLFSNSHASTVSSQLIYQF